MNKKTGISLRIEEDKIDELDALAKATQRDRSFHINLAIENYLEIQKWQIGHIKNAILEADNEEFATSKDLEKILKR